MSNITYAQPVAWATSIGGSSGDGGWDVKVDADKYVYTLGQFAYTADLDPGPGTMMINTNNGPNVFILKQDSSGFLVWVRSFIGTGVAEGFEMAIDDSGNVYSTGYFTSVVDFDPGPGISNMTSSGSKDIFISKLDSSGNFLWAKKIGSPNADTSHAITIDNIGNIYLTGVFSGLADFDPGPGVFNMTSNGSGDIFVLKLDAAGNFQWAKQIGGAGMDLSLSIEYFNNSNISICGGFQDTVDFDPGSGISNLVALGLLDVFVMNMDSAGNFHWANAAGGTASEIARSISDDSDGNLYVTGSFYGTVDFDPAATAYNLTSAGYGDIFILKFDPAGNFTWVKQIGGPNGAGSYYGDNTYSIAISEFNNLFITGFFSNTVDFDPGPGVYNMSGVPGAGFICKLDSAGLFQYANHFEGGDGAIGYSIDVDENESSYITGGWWGSTIVFNATVPYLLSGHGSYDSFTVKYNDVSVGLTEISDTNRVLLYPNPVEDILNIRIKERYKNAEVLITDITGKEIVRIKFDNAMELSLEFNFTPGVYLVNIFNEKERKVFKVIKK